MTPWLSIIVPTIGRRSLERTLRSFQEQPERAGVEVLVVADTHGGMTPDLSQARERVLDEGYTWLEHDAGFHCVGQPQRTFGAHQARAPWVWFSQDDNIAAVDSLATIELVCDVQPRPRPIFCRFLSPWGETIWREPELALGNIDADCLVLPRHIARQVSWGLRYEGDFDAAQQAYHLVHGDVYWCPRVVALARPEAEQVWWTA